VNISSVLRLVRATSPCKEDPAGGVRRSRLFPLDASGPPEREERTTHWALEGVRPSEELGHVGSAFWYAVGCPKTRLQTQGLPGESVPCQPSAPYLRPDGTVANCPAIPRRVKTSLQAFKPFFGP